MLAARGLAIPVAVRAQILDCKDEALLDNWLRRAVTDPSAAAVLTGGARTEGRPRQPRVQG